MVDPRKVQKVGTERDWLEASEVKVEELQSQLTVSEAREAALVEAATKYLKSYGHGHSDGCCMLHHGSQDGTPGRDCYVCTCGHKELVQTLTQSAKPMYEARLAKVERVLGVLGKIMRKVHYHMYGSILVCRVCEAELASQGHTENCELAPLIADMTAERDTLIKLIGEITLIEAKETTNDQKAD